MTWVAVGLAAVNVLQVLGLAWVAAWQQRAAHEVRKLNGTVESEIRALSRNTSSGGWSCGGNQPPPV